MICLKKISLTRRFEINLFSKDFLTNQNFHEGYFIISFAIVSFADRSFNPFKTTRIKL